MEVYLMLEIRTKISVGNPVRYCVVSVVKFQQ